MEQFAQAIRDLADGAFDGVSTGIIIAMAVVAVLLAIAAVVAAVISIFLVVSYVKYNHRKNSLGMTGEQIARKLLDQNGLAHIKVSACGSILFGNSYSHFFKKVRLRRLTWKKTSVSSLAMATQKSSLAVLDKENDPDMKKRIALTPIIYFGPLAFIPLIVIGVLIDLFVIKSNSGIATMVCSVLGLLIYVAAFVLSVMILKTEKKAQAKAIELMRRDSLATEEEIAMCEKLFRLYNIEYVNDMIVSMLELIYRVLQIIAAIQNNKSSD